MFLPCHPLAYLYVLLTNVFSNALVIVIAHRGNLFAGATNLRNDWIIVIN